MEDNNKMSEDLTPLQASIKAAINEHPEYDDRQIAEIVWNLSNPEEEYSGSSPTPGYVGKLRKRFDIEAQPPTFFVSPEDIPEPIDEEEEIEEEEIPFEEAFTHELEFPEEDEKPEIEGLNVDDTQFLVTFTFDKFADWSGWEGWRFSTDSKGRLIDKNERRFIELTNKMAYKYLPDILGNYFLEVMFCYTGLMIVGSKAAGYMKYRKAQQPISKKAQEEQPQQPPAEAPASEIPETETPPTMGEKALGEDRFTARLRRQPA